MGQTIDINARGNYYYDCPSDQWIKTYGFNTVDVKITILKWLLAMVNLPLP
ncbi:hypothetical protein [Chryseobacterium indologenes]|uniref:hypothetical protein n=1 Tax=Chryseobacterium indologenes TaxID=253 RepID=UPI0014867DBE|nr:hypothetical protein [Chryseobacterium indologenes]